MSEPSLKSNRPPQVRWLNGLDVSELAPESAARAVQFCERLVQATTSADDVPSLLRDQLPEVATECSVQWAAVLCKTPRWEIVGEVGRRPFKEWPSRHFEETLDRDAGAFLQQPGWSLIVVPLRSGSGSSELLVLSGSKLKGDDLPFAVMLGRVLGQGIRIVRRLEKDARRIQRLQKTLEVSSRFAGIRETDALLEVIASEATRLLDCDRSSIFIWDREHREVVACPALGVDSGTLRLPDDKGIVGSVIQTGETIRVDDAYNDERFNKSVDKASGYTTRNLLCVPLLDCDGRLLGAFEVMNKRQGSFDAHDADGLTQLGIQAAVALQNAREREQLLRAHQQLTEQVVGGVQIIGESASVVALRGTIQRLAATDLPVLILGESGTGKEVVAQALHYRGPRADNPFIAVNCAALTETLLESELFGHEKGAFTDAHEARQGKFELAEGGALFLDEIGDMSPGGQAKLLRVLEQKVITRVGGAQNIPINVRIIAATNANLAEAVRNKKFREDLYYRLSVVTLEMPPLRDRPEDIIPLADYFLERFSVQANRSLLKLSPEARRRLQAHGWPGNVRELRNLMERVAFLCAGERVEAEDLSFILSPERDSILDMSADLGLSEATKRFQQEFIRRAVRRVRGNMSEAAKLLGLHRSNLYRKMNQLDMSEVEETNEDV